MSYFHLKKRMLLVCQKRSWKAADEIDNITARFSALQSLSMSDLEDNLDRNICQTEAMQAQIANAISQVEEETCYKS